VAGTIAAEMAASASVFFIRDLLLRQFKSANHAAYGGVQLGVGEGSFLTSMDEARLSGKQFACPYETLKPETPVRPARVPSPRARLKRGEFTSA
jgi:hypothetical protein